jgi:predicted ABC-type ATPase
MLIWYVGGVNDHSKRNLVIVAGPSGAGRSTVADFLMLNRNIFSYLNADVIGKGMAAASRAGSDISAGRVLLEEIEVSLARNESIAFESTMSGMSWRSLIKRAKERGYDTTICYVAVSGVEISIERVRRRVAEGGHDIPEGTLRRRFERSITNFMEHYRYLCDYWYFFDNSGSSAKLVGFKEQTKEASILDQITWSSYERR